MNECLLLNSEPQKEAAKSKSKKTAQLNLSSIKYWTDVDDYVPPFAEEDEFELAKTTVLKASVWCLSHTHPFNGPFSGTTQVSRCQKGRTNLYFTEARDSEWQWHQLGHMQVCTSLQTDNHASNPPLKFFRPDAFPAAQSTPSMHWYLSR